MKIKIRFSSGVKYNGQYYLAAMHMNALFKYDEYENKLTFLTCFNKEKKKDCLYLKAFLYKNEAWFIPYRADYIAIVDLENISIQYMPLLYLKKYSFTPLKLKYINILHFKKNFLLLIPQDIDAAMLIDLKKREAKAFYNIVKENMTYPYHSAIFFEEKIYFFPWKENNILVLDLETDERLYLPWSAEQESFGDVVFDEKNKKFFHAPARKNYILLDDLYGKIDKKIKFADWTDKEYKTYYTSEYKRDIFFWGHEKRIVIKIGKDDYSLKTYEININSSGIFFSPICSNEIEALVFDGNFIVKYNEEKDLFYSINMLTTFEEFILEIRRANVRLFDVIDQDKKDIFKEKEIFELNKFILYMCESESLKNPYKKMNIGIEIFKHI